MERVDGVEGWFLTTYLPYRIRRKPTVVFVLPNIPCWNPVSGRGSCLLPQPWVISLLSDILSLTALPSGTCSCLWFPVYTSYYLNQKLETVPSQCLGQCQVHGKQPTSKSFIPDLLIDRCRPNPSSQSLVISGPSCKIIFVSNINSKASY